MDLPSSIRVGVVNIKIRQRRMSNLCGLFHPIKSTIFLDPRMGKSLTRSTLCHEIIHAIAFSYGCDLTGEDAEETLADAWGTGFMQVMSDNPDLRRFLWPK